MKSMGGKVKLKDKTEENHVFEPKICCEQHLWEGGVETGGSPVLCLYFATLFRFQFCDLSLLFPFKYVFTSSLPIPTYLGAYLILSFRSLYPLPVFFVLYPQGREAAFSKSGT